MATRGLATPFSLAATCARPPRPMTSPDCMRRSPQRSMMGTPATDSPLEPGLWLRCAGGEDQAPGMNRQAIPVRIGNDQLPTAIGLALGRFGCTRGKNRAAGIIEDDGMERLADQLHQLPGFLQGDGVRPCSRDAPGKGASQVSGEGQARCQSAEGRRRCIRYCRS